MVNRWWFVGFLVWLFCVEAGVAATQVPIAPMVGGWAYSGTRCEARAPYPSAASAVAGAIARYNVCGDAAIERLGAWGTPTAQTTGACGSSKRYPTFRMGVEVENTRGLSVRHCWNIVDGYTHYRTRSVGCPAGYTGDGERCLPTGVNPLKGLGPCDETRPAAGNPVTVSSGNNYLVVRDFQAAPGVPAFGRFYNSGGRAFDSGLGRGWRHQWAYELRRSANAAISSLQLHRPNGQVWFFTHGADGRWQGDSDIGARVLDATPEHQLAVPEVTQVVEAPDGATEWYDEVGRILLLRDAQGLPFRFEYGVDGDPETLNAVEGPYGHQLTFVYDADHRVARVLTPRGDAIAFTYSERGLDPVMLTEVRYPGEDGVSAADGFSYLYADAALPGALTAVNTLAGQPLSKWTYDAAGRAIRSSHGAAHLDDTRFVYASDETAVTRIIDGATESTTVYRFSRIAGVSRLASLSGDPCRDCGDGRVFTYDERGFPASIEDAEGHLTLLAHDDRGRLICRMAGIPNPVLPAEDRLARAAVRLTLWRYADEGAEAIRETVLATSDPLYLPNACPRDEDGDGWPDADPDAWTRYRTVSRTLDQGRVIATEAFDHRASGSEPRTWRTSWHAQVSRAGHRWLELSEVDGPREDVDDRVHYRYHGAGTAFAGRLWKIERAVQAPDGEVRLLTTEISDYDANGRPLHVRRADGTQVGLEWDARGRLRQRFVDGLEQQFEYDVQHRLVGVLERPAQAALATGAPDDFGLALAIVRDAAGRVVERQMFSVDSHGVRTPLRTEALERNVAGWVTRAVLLATGGSVDAPPRSSIREQAFAYHDLGRLVALTEGGLFTEYRAYNAAGQLVGWHDPRAPEPGLDGPEAQLDRDVLGRVAGVRFTHGDQTLGEAQFARDPFGLPTEVRVNGDIVTGFVADGFGALSALDDPDRGSLRYVRDAAGAVVSKQVNGVPTYSVVRDSLGRPVQVSFPDPAEDIRLFWDEGPACGFGAGRLCAVEDALGTVRYEYDAHGNRVAERREIDGQLHQFSYGFDAFNRLVRVAGPDGVEREYARDAVGRILTVNTAPRSAAAERPIYTAVLNAAGDLLESGFGNGVLRRFTLNGAGQRVGAEVLLPEPPGPEDPQTTAEVPLPVGVLLVAAAGLIALGCRPCSRAATAPVALLGSSLALVLASLAGVAFEGLSLPPEKNRFDAAGNLVETDMARFAYDGMRRLTGMQTAEMSLAFTYDGNGNRGLAGDAAPEIASGRNRLNQSLGARYTYDEAGRMLTMGALHFSYNARGQLAQVSRLGVIVARYRYDYRGRRLWADVAGAIELRHIDDGGRLLATSTGEAIHRRWFWHESRPVAQFTLASEEWLYLLTDGNGTPRLGLNEVGTPVWRWASDGFGSTPPETDPDGDGHAVAMPLRFPGQFAEPLTGLFYNTFRDYVPALGRYLTPDPIGLAGGLNPYLYAEGNPLVRMDPLGLASYRCHAPLNPVHAAIEKSLGFPLRRLSLGPDLAVRHEYLCVVDTDGAVSCGGQAPVKSGNPVYAPGTPTYDSFAAGDCTGIRADDLCFENCLRERFDAPRPQYSLFNIGGENCQAWSTRLEAECVQTCGRAQP